MRPLVDLLRHARGVLALLVLGVAFATPTPAFAANAVWADCGPDGTIDQHHTPAQYADALKNPPADGAEYTDCLSAIRQAQVRDSQTGDKSPTGAGGTGGAGGSGPTGGSTVAPQDLSNALKSSGVDPAKPPTDDQAPPPPVTVDGETVDLSSARVPSIASALSLPLPIAASALIVLISAGLPLVRYVVARFGGPPTGTTSAP